MEDYAEKTGRLADFRARYWRRSGSADLLQHMRSDFRYEDDADDQAWMIFPEFETEHGEPWPHDSAIPEQGIATMWILDRELAASEHARRAIVGARGAMLVGPQVVAYVEIIERLGLVSPARE